MIFSPSTWARWLPHWSPLPQIRHYIAYLAYTIDSALSFEDRRPEPIEYAQFEQIFLRYQPALLEFLYGMTHDREWAADLLQDTFLCAYTATKKLTTVEYPQAWLYRIATNITIKALRHRRRLTPIPLSNLAPDRLPSLDLPDLASEDVAITIAERDAVWTVLAALPSRWRAILLLQTVVGFTVGEIATQLHLTEANVRKILFRAKERYRELHRQFETEGGAR
jgi:RNA polymerase sigma-70 factor, ECF subfamily